jgi:hypothetical protein
LLVELQQQQLLKLLFVLLVQQLQRIVVKRVEVQFVPVVIVK